MAQSSNYQVYLEGGGYLFDLPLSMPEMQKNDEFTYTGSEGVSTTYKVKDRHVYCELVEAETEGGAEDRWRPPVIRYTVRKA